MLIRRPKRRNLLLLLALAAALLAGLAALWAWLNRASRCP